MYNIKEAAARAGVTVPVLRAWERRYGIVEPKRTASGYRQFDEAAVERIRSMRSLVGEGWSPSAAAAAILAGEVQIPAADVRNSDPPASTTEGHELASRFVFAARDLDPSGVNAVLDDLFSRGSFERVVADLLFPALERLGDAWASGIVSVAGEHMASNAVLRRLGQALEAAGPASVAGSTVAVGLPPGGRHEIGALAFAVAARRGGLQVTYLGADLPVEDWVTAVSASDAAVIGVVTPRDRRAALEVARAVRTARPDIVVAFGGDAAPGDGGILRLPGDLRAAVATLDLALAQGPG